MQRYLIKRLLLVIPTLLGILLVNFAILACLPGDPGVVSPGDAGLRAGQIDSESHRVLREQYHLDRPAVARFFYWLSDVLHGDLGVSIATRQPVVERLMPALGVSVRLNLIAFVIIIAVGIPLGIYSAQRRGTTADTVLSALLFGAYALPTFWVATMLVIFLAGGSFLQWFPAVGLEPPDADSLSFLTLTRLKIWHYVLPVIALTYARFALISRFSRVGFLEVLRQDFIRTARAKGASNTQVVWRHAARNSVMPVVTLFATVLPMMLSGTIVVETIFGIPGLGRLFFQAVSYRDYPIVMAAMLFVSIMTLLALVITDVVYAWLDPRIQLE